MVSILSVLVKLAAIQEEQGLTDAAMAARLGIARSTWTEVRNGRLPISAKVQMSAAKAFPELLGDLLMQVSNSPTTPPRAA
jgi:transcriptional regulator with XRE-family HTH domain